MPFELSDNIKNMIAGASAGFITSIVTCPLDVVKTILQNQGKHEGGSVYRGTLGTLSRIWVEEGVRGLYRGLGPTIYGYLPTWSIYFSVYNNLKGVLGKRAGASADNAMVHVVSAMGAGATSSIMTSPLWVIKTRFMTQSKSTSYRYKNTLDAFTVILREEGVRGFYKGLTPSLLGVFHVAVQFPLYERLKRILNSSDNQSFGTNAILVASSSSKMVASVITYPHEVIRTRLQNQTMRPFKYGSIAQTIQMIYKEEGWTAFYKGMPTNLIRTVPASALTIFTYEMVLMSLNSAT
ncbi:mitochondrial carrier [Basidiobolus meristosporus CBS 931.73]|uniref:Mitochondrial carrier n=1 Tax=Basidiobolus meristosporus CBS 931.73 TaxID=1314790 RepID=A0A1Y1YRY2_9FUNG|nr:mitochondrial carrier [Basidiobolus meristosporus CBS 931.73]|eukprot:ORY00793.1 mitochondrial carrier [Basidiobolus meristosporus CBS 931.73]